MTKFELRDYQKECLEATVKARADGVNRQLIAMSTGAGKTVVFSHLPDYHENSLPMLVIAHRKELLEQAKDKIESSNPELKVEIEMGATHASDDSDVVCASVATLGRAGSSRVEKFDKDYFKTIVIDEAHHAAASTYKNILDYFDYDFLLGVTATPKRSDNIGLDDVFDQIVYEKNMLSLIEEGYLSEPISYRYDSPIDLSEVSVRAGDYAVGELSQVVNTDARHMVTLEAYRKIVELNGGDISTVIFCVDIKHAEDLAAYLTKNGHRSKAVSGESKDRDQIMRDHKDGKFPILTNCQVTVEGYDDPGIRLVIMARPTRSSIFYTQAVGRGARLDGDQNIFYVVDIADASKGKRPISILSLMGLPAEFEADGEKLSDTVEKFNALKDKSPSQAVTVKSLEDIEAAWEKIDIFTPPPVNEALLEFSRLLWIELDEDYVINVDDDTKIFIKPTHLGLFEVSKNDELLGRGKSLVNAFAFADQYIDENYKTKINLLTADAGWRSDPPTEKQIKILRRHNVPWEHLTKGQASQIIDKIFQENPRKPLPIWVQKKIEQNKYKNYR